MGIFGFLKKKKIQLHLLSQRLLLANQKNEMNFKKLVISRELFGGAGALWEFQIENPTGYKRCNNQFLEYIDLLIRMAIRNGSVKQLQKTIPKLNQIVKSNLILKQKKSSFLLDLFCFKMRLLFTI